MRLASLSGFWRIVSLLIFTTGLVASAHAQSETSEKPFATEQLDQMLAPIALYPDDLLSNVLVAATYPLEIVEAARWIKVPANAKLKGDALTKALEEKDWDPSVKSLTLTPDVLETMSEKLEWTQKLGDAFLAQQDDVFERIQFLRKKADESGNLKTTKQQKVKKETNYIVIESASPEVVYVPVYQPTVVYGAWWYPAYPPYYWYWGRPASAFVNGFFWGAGYAVSRSLWGWGYCDWGRRNIHIDVNRYNKINVNRTQINSNSWKHDPKHRGPVPYRDKSSREKYGKVGKGKVDRDQFRGHEPDKVKQRLKDGGPGKAKDKLGDGGAGKVKDKLGDGGAGKVKDKLGDGGAGKVKDKAAGGKSRDLPSRPKTKDIKKPSRPSHSALNVKPKPQVKRESARGAASRKSAASKMSRGGGGVKRGGGGLKRR